MSDEENASAEDGGEKKGGGVMRVLGVVLTALIAGAAGAGGSFAVLQTTLLDKLIPGADSEIAAGSDAEASPSDGAADFQQRLLALEPVVVNIQENGRDRFLKVTVELETDSLATHEELGMRLPQLKDAIITLTSSKRVEDVADFEGKVLLKEDLRDRINQLLSEGSVEAVLLTEFVVQ
jgi:flagellar FliL protein